MVNFLLGAIAGGLIASVVTISVARHPETQARLGMAPVASAPVRPAAPSRMQTPCEAAAPRREAVVGTPEMLFSRKRFWHVAP